VEIGEVSVGRQPGAGDQGGAGDELMLVVVQLAAQVDPQQQDKDRCKQHAGGDQQPGIVAAAGRGRG
jgi:hypothetical protein